MVLRSTAEAPSPYSLCDSSPRHPRGSHASRKLELLGFAETMAFEEIGALRRVWSTVTPDWNALDLAGRLQQRFSLSFWDALLIASCIEAGARRLSSEDFGGCRAIESLEIVNPFEET